MRPLLLALVAVFLTLPACTITEEDTGRDRSYGSVVHGELDHVWAVTQQTVLRHASGVDVEGGPRRITGRWRDANVSVQVQRKAPMETILRIGAQLDGRERPDIAEQLQLLIQQALLGR